MAGDKPRSERWLASLYEMGGGGGGVVLKHEGGGGGSKVFRWQETFQGVNDDLSALTGAGGGVKREGGGGGGEVET